MKFNVTILFFFLPNILVITMFAFVFVLRHEMNVYQIPVMKNRITQTNTIEKWKEKKLSLDNLHVHINVKLTGLLHRFRTGQ